MDCVPSFVNVEDVTLCEAAVDASMGRSIFPLDPSWIFCAHMDRVKKSSYASAAQRGVVPCQDPPGPGL